MDNPILKRLGALDINDDLDRQKLKETMSELEIVLDKAKQKVILIEYRIKECTLIRDNLLDITKIDLDAVKNFNAKLHSLALKKLKIDKAIKYIVEKMEMGYNEEKEEKE